MARVWTDCCGVVLVITILCPAASLAQTPIDDAAVTAGCREAIKNAGQPQSFDAGMCLGIIKGLHYLSRDVCVPREVKDEAMDHDKSVQGGDRN